MSNQIAVLLVVAFFVIPHAAEAQNDNDSNEWKKIQTDEFEVRIPASWSNLSDTQTILTLAAPVTIFGDSFRENVRVKKYPLNSVNDLEIIHSVQLKNVEDQFNLVGSGFLQSDGARISWIAITQKRPGPNQMQLVKIDYSMVYQEHLLVLHAMCETEALDEHRPTFDAIARSVRFSDPVSTPKNLSPKTSRSQDSSANDQGRQVGRYTFYAMLAVGGIWLVFRLFVRPRRKNVG